MMKMKLYVENRKSSTLRRIDKNKSLLAFVSPILERIISNYIVHRATNDYRSRGKKRYEITYCLIDENLVHSIEKEVGELPLYMHSGDNSLIAIFTKRVVR